MSERSSGAPPGAVGPADDAEVQAPEGPVGEGPVGEGPVGEEPVVEEPVVDGQDDGAPVPGELDDAAQEAGELTGDRGDEPVAEPQESPAVEDDTTDEPATTVDPDVEPDPAVDVAGGPTPGAAPEPAPEPGPEPRQEQEQEQKQEAGPAVEEPDSAPDPDVFAEAVAEDPDPDVIAETVAEDPDPDATADAVGEPSATAPDPSGAPASPPVDDVEPPATGAAPGAQEAQDHHAEGPEDASPDGPPAVPVPVAVTTPVMTTAPAPAAVPSTDDLGVATTERASGESEPQDRREDGRVPAPAAEPLAAATAPGPSAEGTSAPAATTGRERLLAAIRPRATRGQLLSGLLCLLLGLALVTQLRERSEADLASLRQSELIALLDDTTERADRLQQEVRELTGTRDELASSSDQTEAARELARERLDVLGVLAGTVPATGPGIELTITGGEVGADVLLGAVQEMRDAGAEAIQLGDVRVVASTYFVDVTGGQPAVEVDGVVLEAPFTFRAIGSAATLASAMEFPGGVVETVQLAGGTALVVQREAVEVTALRPVEAPAYARPADPPTDPPTAPSS